MDEVGERLHGKSSDAGMLRDVNIIEWTVSRVTLQMLKVDIVENLGIFK
ncbi:hypothetical protein KAS14_01965 [Candidatus Bathyarchaeota archaeon]|nr:hypothetical protein [Candidatus Bathyarchaeota archaeon]